MDKIKIPNRFESLKEAFEETRPLIVAIEEDLKRFLAAKDMAETQGGGILLFLYGESGCGKTTSVHSVIHNIPDQFESMTEVPTDIDLREIVGWIKTNTPKKCKSKSHIILIDGREETDDAVGIKQLFSGLNQYLRSRDDVIIVWPTTSSTWRREMLEVARSIGGENLAPIDAEYQVDGPDKLLWRGILDRILLQYQKSITDVGLGDDYIQEQVLANKTIGKFLRKIGQDIAERTTKKREAKKLPRIIFVISSEGDVVGECNRIRRAGVQYISPEPLLAHSPRSKAGRYWTARNSNSFHHLAYILSLFDTRLVTLSPSAVVHSIILSTDAELADTRQLINLRPDVGNASRIARASELLKLLQNTLVHEYTSKSKSKPNANTIKSFKLIQKLSKTHHKPINKAVLGLFQREEPTISFDDNSFEISFDGIVQADAKIKLGREEFLIEFHHIGESSCNAPHIASYIMEKIELYGKYHKLLPE